MPGGGVTACLEIDNVTAPTMSSGECNDAKPAGGSCSDAQRDCVFGFEVDVFVHDLCCCSSQANGAHVWSNTGAESSQWDFVPAGGVETIYIENQTSCFSDGPYGVQACVAVQCAGAQAGTPQAAQVSVCKWFTCSTCSAVTMDR